MKWLALTAGWQIAAWTATAVLKSPGNYVDIYYKDRYFVVSKRALIAGVAIVVLVPVALTALRRARAARSSGTTLRPPTSVV